MTKIKNWIKTHKTESIVIAASTIIFAAGAAIGFSVGDSMAIDWANKKLNNFAIMNPIKLTSGKVLSVSVDIEAIRNESINDTCDLVIDYVSDVIVDLTLSGASRDEINEAVQYSANIIDAKRNHDILKISTLYNEFKSKFDKENKNDRTADT